MSVEWFSKLKEVDSLTKMRINHLKSLSDQEARLATLLQRKDQELSLVSRLQSANHSLQQELFEMEQKLKTSSEQKQRFLDRGADEEKIQGFSREISSLEDRGFGLLEEIEANTQELERLRTFLAGLEETISEINAEAQTEIGKLRAEVRNIELRVSLLLEELPSDFRNLLLKTTAKNLAHGPFTRVDNGTCFFCRFKISKIYESEIDMQQSLKTCPQCDRIFLPYGL